MPREPSSCCTASAAPAARGTGSSPHLDPERYRPLALDLPGHGEAAELRAADHASPAASSTCSTRAPERFALCGYSMGGRVALHVALAAPERVERLVLVSTHRRHRGSRPSAPQRRRADRRARRRARTRSRSRSSSSAGAPSRCSPPTRREVGELAREDQRRNRPAALAAVLRGIGTGEMAAAVGSAARADDAGRPCSRASATRSSARSAGAWRSCCRDGELAIVPGRPRPAAGEPARGGARARGREPRAARRPARGRAARRSRPPRAGSGSVESSNSPSVARPQGGSGPREASAAAACTAAATPSGPSSVEAR